MQTIGDKPQPGIGDVVEFMRSDGDIVVALVTSVDLEAQTCDLEYEGCVAGDGFVEGEFYTLRKRCVSFRQLGITYDVRGC